MNYSREIIMTELFQIIDSTVEQLKRTNDGIVIVVKTKKGNIINVLLPIEYYSSIQIEDRITATGTMEDQVLIPIRHFVVIPITYNSMEPFLKSQGRIGRQLIDNGIDSLKLALQLSKLYMRRNTMRIGEMGLKKAIQTLANIPIGEISVREADRLLDQWDQQFDRRQLRLLGVSDEDMKKADEGPLPKCKRTIIRLLCTEPFTCHHVPLAICVDIASRLGYQATDELIRESNCYRWQIDMLKRGYVNIPLSLSPTKINSSMYAKSYPIKIVKIEDENRLYITRVYKMEKSIAEWLHQSSNSISLQLTTQDSPDLSDIQNFIIEVLFKHHLSYICGEAGTGKTTLVPHIVRNLLGNSIERILILAPTGAAVNRLKSVILMSGICTVELLDTCIMTIDMYCTTLPFQPQFLIVDETSMMSYSLAYKLFSIIPSTIPTCFIGDDHQLSPVSFGNFYSALIKSQLARRIHLTTNYRVKNGDAILINAQKIAQYNPDITPAQNVRIIQNKMECIEQLLQLFKKEGTPASAITIITPFKKYGDLDKLNKIFWSVYSGTSSSASVFEVGQRVMMTKNKYGDDTNVMNGEEGIIESIQQHQLTVVFGNGESTKKLVYYEQPPNRSGLRISDLRVSFCRTIHTAQGSEYDICIIWMDRAGFMCSNLLYTAVTRAKKELWMIGNVEVMKQVIMTRPNETNESLNHYLL